MLIICQVIVSHFTQCPPVLRKSLGLAPLGQGQATCLFLIEVRDGDEQDQAKCYKCYDILWNW